MIAASDVSDALGMIPGWDARNCRITEMHGGFTNRVFHVRSGDRECVLRLDTPEGGFTPGRRCELEIMASAAHAGIAPTVLYANPDAGVLAMEYLHGRVWQDADLEVRSQLEALADLLRRVHALPVCGRTIDLCGYAENYRALLDAGDERRRFASHCVRLIRERTKPEFVSCCHNDVVATNVIESGSLKLIDWEYAADNEPLFDLASVIAYHDLEKKRQRILLGAYAGGTSGELEERLAGQIRIFDAIQWLWLAARQRVSPMGAQARRLEELQGRIL